MFKLTIFKMKGNIQCMKNTNRRSVTKWVTTA